MFILFIFIFFQIILFTFFFNKYFENIIYYILLPISKQNTFFNIENKNIYFNNNNYYFIDQSYNNKFNYPIFEINLTMFNITYIITYYLIIYLLIYILPFIILQIYIFIFSCLYKHEKINIYKYTVFFIIIFFLLIVYNNYINIYYIINFFLNYYQELNFYVFDLNFNFYEYIWIYTFFIFISYIWIYMLIINKLIFSNNKYIIYITTIIIMLYTPIDIYLYIYEIIFFFCTNELINLIFLLIFYNKRIPGEKG